MGIKKAETFRDKANSAPSRKNEMPMATQGLSDWRREGKGGVVNARCWSEEGVTDDDDVQRASALAGPSCRDALTQDVVELLVSLKRHRRHLDFSLGTEKGCGGS